MHNNYLEVLGLQQGATESDVKQAYRKLVKKYHPDISKDEEAKSQFIKITEAYRFLLEVGPRPNHEYESFNYDPQRPQYHTRREEAKAYAKSRAEEEAAYQQSLLNQLYSHFNYVGIVIIVFNILLIVDYYLPAQAHQETIVSATQVIYRDRLGKSTHRHDIITFTDFKLKLNKNQAEGLQKSEAEIHTTPLLNVIKSANIYVEEGKRNVIPRNRAYRMFQWIIPLAIIFSVVYYKLDRRHQNKITFAVFIAIIFLIEIFFVFRYSL